MRMRILNPIEREREYAQRAIMRYVKACGFKPFAAASSDQMQRYRRKHMLIEVNTEKPEFVISPGTLENRFITRGLKPFLAQMERLMEETQRQREQAEAQS